MIDLHVHTIASDGIYSARDIVRKAKERGLKAIAITDHDSVAALPEAMSAGQEYGIEVIPGVEISTDFTSGLAHILGYYVDYQNVQFVKELKEMKAAREERAKAILTKLEDLGFNVPFSKVVQIAGEATIGRPHVAAAMVELGQVPDIVTAFDLYLAEGRPAYADRLKVTPQEACQMIARAGGIVVLAHPLTIRPYQPLLESLLPYLAGMEVYYSEFTNVQKNDLLKMAKRYKLIATGGSDFHGEGRAGSALGSGGTPDNVLLSLKKIKARKTQII